MAINILPPRRILSDTRGGITMIGALSLSSIVGMTGLAMEVGQGYAEKVENQRIADAAALAAALAYSAASDDTVILPAARAIAVANGLTINSVVAPAPTTDAGGRKIVTATITTAVPLYLTRILTTATSYNVTSTGVAAVTPAVSTSSTTTSPSAGSCFLALSTADSTGITVSGSSTITGTTGTTGCDVQAVTGILVNGSAGITARNIQSNGSILVDGSATLRAVEVDAAGSITWPGWNGSAIVTSPTPNNRKTQTSTIGDPLANSSALNAQLAKVTNNASYPTYAGPAALVAPSVATSSTVEWTFSDASGPAQASLNGNTWVVPAGTYNVRSITISGSRSVRFAPGSIVNVRNDLSLSGSTSLQVQGSNNSWTVGGAATFTGSGSVSFGGGTYSFGSFQTVGSTTFDMGDGDFTVAGAARFGPGTKTVGTGIHQFGRLIIDGSGRVTIGAGALTAVAGIDVGGSATLTVRSGARYLGATAGQSLKVAGSTTVTFEGSNVGFSASGGIWIDGSTTVTVPSGNVLIGTDGTRAIYLTGGATLNFGDGTFVAAGPIETGGTSNLVFGATANHYVKGSLTLNGAVTFGAGAYTVWGNFVRSASMGSTGTDVSFYLDGTVTLSGSVSTAFSAPTSNRGEALADILFASRTTGASNYTGSSQNTYSGAVYLPNSAVTISGSGRIMSGSCFQLIAKTITITGSGSGGSRCSGVASLATNTTSTGSSTTPTVALIR